MGTAVVLAVVASGCITSAKVTGSVLTIVGSQYADTITLRLQPGNPNILEVDDASDPAIEYTFDRSTFSSIVVEGREDDDTLVIDETNGAFTDTESTTLRGEAGNDTLVGGAGVQVLEGGPGADTLRGGVGADAVRGGDDADLIGWIPGDGNDIVDGGLGSDRLELVGANAGEAIGLTNVGGFARLTRDIANVTLDLVGIEAADIRPYGGTDSVDIGDLTGTGLSTISLDLASSGGNNDNAVDTVRVPPTAVIGREGAQALVTGFGTQVRVRNGVSNDRVFVEGAATTDRLNIDGTMSPDRVTVSALGAEAVVAGITPGLPVVASAVEVIDVDLGGGDDIFVTSGNVASVTTLDVDGGDGRDAIAGGNGADVIDGGPDVDLLDGNQGSDTIRGGDGGDTIVWDPGDGSDIVAGGGGSDRLLMNASAASESIAVTRLGPDVLLTRDVANVNLSIAGVESLAVNAFGGMDIVTVHDLAGTGMTAVDIDLGVSGGGPDSVSDQVVVNGTTAPDDITVLGIGDAVEVLGLPTWVRIANPDQFADMLTVNGLGGTDSFHVAPSASNLLDVDPIQ